MAENVDGGATPSFHPMDSTSDGFHVDYGGLPFNLEDSVFSGKLQLEIKQLTEAVRWAVKHMQKLDATVKQNGARLTSIEANVQFAKEIAESSGATGDEQDQQLNQLWDLVYQLQGQVGEGTASPKNSASLHKAASLELITSEDKGGSAPAVESLSLEQIKEALKTIWEQIEDKDGKFYFNGAENEIEQDVVTELKNFPKEIEDKVDCSDDDLAWYQDRLAELQFDLGIAGDNQGKTMAGITMNKGAIDSLRRQMDSLERKMKKTDERTRQTERQQEQKDAAQDELINMQFDTLKRDISTRLQKKELHKVEELLLGKLTTMDLEVNSRIKVLVDDVNTKVVKDLSKVQDKLESVVGSVSAQMTSIEERLANNDQNDNDRDKKITEEINTIRQDVDQAVSQLLQSGHGSQSRRTQRHRETMRDGVKPAATIAHISPEDRASQMEAEASLTTAVDAEAALGQIRLEIEEKMAAFEARLGEVEYGCQAAGISIHDGGHQGAPVGSISPTDFLNNRGGPGSPQGPRLSPRPGQGDRSNRIGGFAGAVGADGGVDLDGDDLSPQAMEDMRNLEARVSDLENTVRSGDFMGLTGMSSASVVQPQVADAPSGAPSGPGTSGPNTISGGPGVPFPGKDLQGKDLPPDKADVQLQTSESFGGKPRSRGIEDLINRVTNLEALIRGSSPGSRMGKRPVSSEEVIDEVKSQVKNEVKGWVKDEILPIRSKVEEVEARGAQVESQIYKKLESKIESKIDDLQVHQEAQLTKALEKQLTGVQLEGISRPGSKDLQDQERAKQATSPHPEYPQSPTSPNRVRSPNDFGPLTQDGNSGEFVHHLSMRVKEMESRLSELENQPAPDIKRSGAPTAIQDASCETDLDILPPRPPRGQDPLDWLQKRIDRVMEPEDQEKIITGEHIVDMGKKREEMQASMQASINLLEKRMEDITSKMDSVANQRESIGRPMVAEELQRLRCCFEYLMRMVPQDVNRALKFFRNSEDPENAGTSVLETLNTGNDELDLKLGVQFDTMKNDMNTASKELKREVGNVFTAVRGVQRDGEVSNMKLDDIGRRHEALRSRVEWSLPQILSVLQELRKSKSDSRLGTPATADGKSRPFGTPSGSDKTQQLATLSPATPEGALKRSSGTPSGGKKRLPGELEKFLTVDLDERLGTPHPYVSQTALHKTLEVMQTDITKWLSQLRDDVLEALNGKADSAQLQALVVKLQQEKQILLSHQGPNTMLPSDATAEYAAISKRQLQGRCISCDAKLDSKTGLAMNASQNPVPMAQTSKDATYKSWPARAPLMDGGTGPVKSRPRTLKKDLSLPSITNS